jgi:2-aminoadipate transaminase
MGNAVYLSSFSKILAPGLRVAWAVCPPDLARHMVMAKQSADLHTSALAQMVAYEFKHRGWLPAQIERICRTYRRRRDAMCEAIAEFFPEGVTHTCPEGGLFLWIDLPETVDAMALLDEGRRFKVAFVPGLPFYADGQGSHSIRLSFASVPPDAIHEGIRRLGDAIKAKLA